MTDIETWKQIPHVDYRGYYKVSNLGRVYSLKSEKVLRPALNTNGYFTVGLIDHRNKQHTVTVHSLVALAFLGPRPANKVVDHLDRCKTNNRASNLRYATLSENGRNRKDSFERGDRT